MPRHYNITRSQKHLRRGAYKFCISHRQDCSLSLFFFFFSLLFIAEGSCTASHPIDMSNLNSDFVFPISSGRAMVIAYQTIPCSGEVTRWSASVKGSFKLSFLVWERNFTSVYNLVGRNDFDVKSDEDSITVMNFEPALNSKIAVKAGQVVGLYSIVDGTEAGVKAVMVLQTGGSMLSQNITYDFVTESLDGITSIDITSSSISSVLNVRPLISAVIESECT